MKPQYEIGDAIKVMVCTGVFSVKVRGYQKGYDGEISYKCSGNGLSTTVTNRSIVGTIEHATHDCTIGCCFRTDKCTGSTSA